MTDRYLTNFDDYLNCWDTTVDDIYHGLKGRDTLYLSNGNEFAYGGRGDDLIMGHGGQDWLYGQNGNDVLNGGAGWDFLYGQGGDDLLGDTSSADGYNYLYGGAGNDYIFMDFGYADAGKGKDTVSVTTFDSFAQTEVILGSGADTLELKWFDVNEDTSSVVVLHDFKKQDSVNFQAARDDYSYYSQQEIIADFDANQDGWLNDKDTTGWDGSNGLVYVQDGDLHLSWQYEELVFDNLAQVKVDTLF